MVECTRCVKTSRHWFCAACEREDTELYHKAKLAERPFHDMRSSHHVQTSTAGAGTVATGATGAAGAEAGSISRSTSSNSSESLQAL